MRWGTAEHVPVDPSGRRAQKLTTLETGFRAAAWPAPLLPHVEFAVAKARKPTPSSCAGAVPEGNSGRSMCGTWLPEQSSRLSTNTPSSDMQGYR